MSYKKYYQRFIQAHPQTQHYACHSHHYWPDVTRHAMLQYWDDTAALVDDKWHMMFGQKVPRVQQLISNILQIRQPQQWVFAPNTHELLFRLLTCFDWSVGLKVLTTDSEFHSFSRQINRLAETGSVQVVKVSTEPFATFSQRFCDAAAQLQPDLVFFSQVFFNSGLAIAELEPLVSQLEQRCSATIAVDGYHGFMALPTDLSALEGRIFYLAGSYKYAQGGEGCCFMLVPANNKFRPLYTGWFAEFGALADVKSQQVGYAADGYQFAGATMDLTALYRLQAVLELFAADAVTVTAIHRHVQDLQQVFLTRLDQLQHPWLNRGSLLMLDPACHGHFLTFRGPDPQSVAALSAYLKRHQIETDYRGERLRFGFAMYHDATDIDLSCLAQADV